MPFCTTIIDRYTKKCLDNPNDIPSKYMTMSFPVLQDFTKNIQGGIHSGDSTARPQILSKNDNSHFYNLVNSFYKETGVGALINTSFNMHGEPIVGHPRDALNTLIKSDLEGVMINNTLISRKESI